MCSAELCNPGPWCMCVLFPPSKCEKGCQPIIMTIAAALHRTYLQPLRAQIPIGGFLLPGFFNHCQPLHHASTATFIPPSSTTSVPESHHKAKRRAKLSKEQQKFLDSAVSRPFPRPPPGRFNFIQLFNLSSSASTKPANSPQP